MSATTLAAPIRVDTAGVHARPSIGRLVTVELRKMVDTRAGFWLQIARPPAGAIRACPLRFAALQRFELFPVALGCAQFVPRIDPPCRRGGAAPALRARLDCERSCRRGHTRTNGCV